jgi:hypothetical protein
MWQRGSEDKEEITATTQRSAARFGVCYAIHAICKLAFPRRTSTWYLLKVVAGFSNTPCIVRDDGFYSIVKTGTLICPVLSGGKARYIKKIQCWLPLIVRGNLLSRIDDGFSERSDFYCSVVVVFRGRYACSLGLSGVFQRDTQALPTL